MNKLNSVFFLSFIIMFSSSVYAQQKTVDLNNLDKNFLESLPDDVRDDVVEEFEGNNGDSKVT